MNRDKFREIFDEGYLMPPYSSYGLFMFNQCRNNGYKYYCFTEGSTDDVFYKNVIGLEFLKNDTYFIPMQNIQEAPSEFDIGKSGVMNTYNDIRTRNNLLHYLNRCIFLIDHDYEGALSSKVVVPETLRDNLTITKLYSFENYFLIEENIDKIFKLFGLDDVNVFKQKLNNFVEEISEYNRLKSAINISYMKGVNYRPPVNYRKKYDSNEIFIFDFNNVYDYYFRKELFDRELNNMRTAVNNFEKAKEYFENDSLKFRNNINFVRGHDLYRFLQYYLWQRHNIDIRPRKNNINYIRMINECNIDIDIKNGLGKLMNKKIA